MTALELLFGLATLASSFVFLVVVRRVRNDVANARNGGIPMARVAAGVRWSSGLGPRRMVHSVSAAQASIVASLVGAAAASMFFIAFCLVGCVVIAALR